MSSGSGRDVFSPSERRTIADEPKKPTSTAPASRSRADWSIVSGFPAIALSDAKRPWPSDVAAGGGQPLDRSDDVLLDVARPEHRHRAVTESDDADLDRARLLLDEGLRSLLGGLHRVGSRSSAPHAVRHVEGQDHGAFPSGTARLTVGRASPKRTRASARRKRVRDVPPPATRRRRSSRDPRTRAGRALRAGASIHQYATTKHG